MPLSMWVSEVILCLKMRAKHPSSSAEPVKLGTIKETMHNARYTAVWGPCMDVSPKCFFNPRMH